MADLAAARPRRLAAEVRAEVGQLRRTLDELASAGAAHRMDPQGRVPVYALAALLDTLYTGFEKTFLRVATAFADRPAGPGVGSPGTELEFAL